MRQGYLIDAIAVLLRDEDPEGHTRGGGFGPVRARFSLDSCLSCSHFSSTYTLNFAHRFAGSKRSTVNFVRARALLTFC